MVTKFVPDRGGIAEIGRCADLLKDLEEVANGVVDSAKNLAPELSGDYKEGIDMESGVEGKTAIARVNANDFKSHWVEFGTSDTPTFAPLRKAAEEQGLEVKQ